MKNILLCLTLLLTATFNAQVRPSLDNILTSEDSVDIATIAMYPDSLKPGLLTACQKPEVLLKAEALRKNTSEAFRNLTGNYTKEEQKKLWDLARYPQLIQEITQGGKKTREELETISAKYPKELHETIKEYGRKHYEVLGNINGLYESSEAEFEKMLADYPEQTQAAYRGLLNRPDALSALSNNMHLTVILGDLYKTDPTLTLHMLDSVKKEHLAQTAKDLEDWKSGLEKNPEAKKEMEQAAREFSRENSDNNDYTDDVYNTAPPADANPPGPTNGSTVIVNNYYMQPYPYWFGYPVWYDFPYWYPYPFWYHCGFYWGPAGVVYVGFPTPFFMHWYLYHPYHNYYYSHFTDYCIGYSNYHYGPRHARTGFNAQVRDWRRVNEPHLPKGFFNNDPQRAGRIKELGKFELDYHNSTKGIFGKNITRPEFLQNNQGYYPHIKPVLTQPGFNQPIRYPQQQNPVKFNMGPLQKPIKVSPGKINLPGGGQPRNIGVGKRTR